jgi:hypothetical protein
MLVLLEWLGYEDLLWMLAGSPGFNGGPDRDARDVENSSVRVCFLPMGDDSVELIDSW